jgi:hypothetical protein
MSLIRYSSMLDRIELLRAKSRRLGRGDFRASDGDRDDALRRLRLHGEMGHLDQAGLLALHAAVDAAETPNQIAAVFVEAGLPELPARSPTTERRASTQDRRDAIGLLEKAYAEGRLEAHECAVAKDRVSAARTQSEIDAAFHGLSTPSRVARKQKASDVTAQAASTTTRVAANGGQRLGRAFRRGVLGAGAMMLGAILLIAGIGTVALLCFVAAVFFLVSAAISLVTPQSRS